MNDSYQNNLRISNNLSAPLIQSLPISGNSSFNEARGLIQPGNRIPMPPPRTGIADYANPYAGNYGYSQGYNNGGSYLYGGNNYASSYTSPYSSYGASPLSYGRMSSHMSPYNNLTSSAQSSFLQDAQENSRDAFAGIESIVSAFGSINMMIESTYHALHSSFNAVLSVVDNFSRLKTHFGQILSAFTLIKTCQWLLRKLLYLIGLRARDPTTESAWKTAASSSDVIASTTRSYSWPTFTFVIAVYAMPFLMWKFLSSILNSNKASSDWTSAEDNQYNAVALYSYQAQRPDELSFTAGDKFKLAPMKLQTDKSWPIAFNGTSTGVVPVTYIQIKLNNSFESENSANSSLSQTSSFKETFSKEFSSVQTKVNTGENGLEVTPAVHKTKERNVKDSIETE